MGITFVLLGLSIITVWLPSVSVGQLNAPLWSAFFAAAVLSGLWHEYLEWIALAWFGGMMACSYLAVHQVSAVRRFFFSAIAIVIGLALATHHLPGFNNPVLFADLHWTPNSASFTQYLNFDKGGAGLIILAFFCRRIRLIAEWRELFHRTWPVTVITVCAVMIVALGLGYVEFFPKFSLAILVFLAANLLFTCVAEEAFFRGFVQERLALVVPYSRLGVVLTVVFSGLLFGLAHVAGGAIFVFLASLAGLGYAWAYAASHRVEAAIATHFAVNTFHVVGFTYPYVQ